MSYKAYLDTEDVKNEQGQLTGEKRVIYADNVPIAASVLPASHTVSQQMFGTSLDYESVVVTHEAHPLKEVDLIEIDGEEYVIRRIAKNLNTTGIAVRRVEIGA